MARPHLRRYAADELHAREGLPPENPLRRPAALERRYRDGDITALYEVISTLST